MLCSMVSALFFTGVMMVMSVMIRGSLNLPTVLIHNWNLKDWYVLGAALRKAPFNGGVSGVHFGKKHGFWADDDGCRNGVF